MYGYSTCPLYSKEYVCFLLSAGYNDEIRVSCNYSNGSKLTPSGEFPAIMDEDGSYIKCLVVDDLIYIVSASAIPAAQPVVPENPAPSTPNDTAAPAETTPEQPAAPTAPSHQGTVYTTKSGDTLSKIAKELYNDSKLWRSIYELNKDMIKNPNVIHSNIQLMLP